MSELDYFIGDIDHVIAMLKRHGQTERLMNILEGLVTAENVKFKERLKAENLKP